MAGGVEEVGSVSNVRRRPLQTGLCVFFAAVQLSCLPVLEKKKNPLSFCFQMPSKPYGLAQNKSNTLTSSTSEWHSSMRYYIGKKKKKKRPAPKENGFILIQVKEYLGMCAKYLFECLYDYHWWLTWIYFLFNLFVVFFYIAISQLGGEVRSISTFWFEKMFFPL